MGSSASRERLGFGAAMEAAGLSPAPLPPQSGYRITHRESRRPR